MGLFFPFLQCTGHTLIAFYRADSLPVIGIDIAALYGSVLFIFVNIEGLVQHLAVRITDQTGPLFGICHTSHQIDVPIYQFFKKFRPFPVHVLIFPAGIGSQLLKILVTVSALWRVIVHPFLKIVGKIIAYTYFFLSFGMHRYRKTQGNSNTANTDPNKYHTPLDILIKMISVFSHAKSPRLQTMSVFSDIFHKIQKRVKIIILPCIM